MSFQPHTLCPFARYGARTAVVWRMKGPSPYLSKVMNRFVSMDRIIGGDFEQGLSQLKTLSEQ
jgi:hypothetical protein